MHLVFAALTMLILPLVSIGVDHLLHPPVALIDLVGRWFVFWSAGVRLAVAGLRQLIQPEFTARRIFQMSSDEALPVVRELGIANISMGLVGLLSLGHPTFVLPAAIASGFFYGVAGIRHVLEPHRSRNESISMVTDLFVSAVLLIFVGAVWLSS